MQKMTISHTKFVNMIAVMTGSQINSHQCELHFARSAAGNAESVVCYHN
jgi:hypothetical protein